MQTLKIRYEVEHFDDKNIIQSYQRQYSNCLHFAYNRLKDGVSEKECRALIKTLNHVEMVDVYMVQCAIKEAEQLLSTNDKVVFGGYGNFLKRCKGKISKEEYKSKRLNPLYVMGEATHYHSNRKFQINSNHISILFKPCKSIHMNLNLVGLKKNYKKILSKLYKHQILDDVPITYKLSKDHIYISFDETKVFDKSHFNSIENRVMALDLNPNYIGWSIVDWKSENEYKLVSSGVYNFKSLNDKEYAFNKLKLPSTDQRRIHINNKRKHEVLEVSKKLVDIARHYLCELFAIEDLSISSNDKKKGKNYNRLCNNQWIRCGLTSNLNKRCNIYGIKFHKSPAQYSSTIGNILYRENETPDMVNSSIEIGRRTFEFHRQYVKKTISKNKNVVFPNMKKFDEVISQSLEELGINENFNDWKSLHSHIKNSKLMYRVPFDEHIKWFKFNSKNSNVGFYEK